jgi:hypothetical protein
MNLPEKSIALVAQCLLSLIALSNGVLFAVFKPSGTIAQKDYQWFLFPTVRL